MASKFQKVFIIIILCIAVIFISGILLPRYLSNQYFQLRRELNSQRGESKYSSRENLIHVAKLESQDKIENTLSNENIKVTEKLQSGSNLPGTLASSLQASAKVRHRSKRRAPPDEQHKELFSWNFNLNVTRHQNLNSQDATKDVPDTSHENKHLSVALYANGKGKRKTAFSELLNALRSIETFLNRFFVNRIENTTYQEGLTENQLVHLEKGSTTKSEMEATQNPDIVKFDVEGSGDELFSQRGREGKFIFGPFNIFGFGKSLDKSTSFPKEESTISSTEDETDSNASKINKESLESSHPPKSEFVTENSQKPLNFHPDSLVSQTISETDFVEIVSNVSEFNLAEIPEQDECSDCDTGVFELPVLTSERREILNATTETTIHPTEPLFTDEVLEMFCMSLVNKVEESQQLSDTEEGNGFDSEHNAQNEQNQLRSSQNPSILDLLILFNSLSKKESKPDSDVIEDSFLVTNDSASESELSKRRQSRFIDFSNIFGFGSGRSAIVDQDEFNDLTSEELKNMIELENLPSILDCENYFRKKQSIKMFPKPNLMDMISDPKIQLVDFANATISPKLKEQHLQFLTDLLKTNLNNTVETFDKNSDDVVEKKDSAEENILLPESESNKTINEIFADKDKEIFTRTESSDLNGNDKLTYVSTDSDEGVLQTTEMQRDGRLVNIFGFGSGNNERSLGSEERWFLSGFFGSGARSFETLDSVIESDRNEELGSGDAFKSETALFSDNILTPDTRPTEITYIENECENDCSYENINTTEQSPDCGDYGCSFEDSHDSVNEQLNDDHIFKNESDCHENCDPLITVDNNKEYDEVVENTFTIEQTNVESTNLTENLRTHENCSCLHKNSDRNITFSECDECSFSAVHPPDESYETTESYPSKVSEDKSRTNSKEDHENGCSDCNYRKDLLHEKQAVDSDKNASFSECDECSFNVIHTPDKPRESTESYLFTEVITDDTKQTKSYEDYGSDCHDCNPENLFEKHITDLKKNMTFPECDECDFNVLHMPDESYETTEYFQSKELGLKDINGTQPYEDYGGCHDCNYENEEKQSSEIIPDLKNLNQSDIEVSAIKNMEFRSTLATFSAGIVVDKADNGKNIDSFTETLDAIQNQPNDLTTEMKPRRFMGTIFLTGSGDGGLFGDSGEPIYLVEEESTIVLPDFSRRRGKLDDTLVDSSEMLSESSPKETKQKTSTHDTINLVEEESTAVSPILISRKRGRLDLSGEGNLKELRQKNAIKNDLSTGKDSSNVGVSFGVDGKKPLKKERTTFSTNVDEKAVTVSSDVFLSSFPSFNEVSKTSTELPRFCNSARECNAALNERCVTIDSSHVCGCRGAYVRHKETRQCVVKRIVETSMKLPAEEFDEDLKNPFSPRYKQMRNDSNYMMWLLLRDTPELLKIIAEIDVAEFNSGSLIVSWNLVFAVENESEAELIKDLGNDLQTALKVESLIQKAPLNISNATLISLNSEIDPCKSTELNYCSVNAICVWNEAVPGRFTCICKEHYSDVSTNPRYAGETCIDKCSPEYCGPYGHCLISANDEIQCLCSGLYFGRRCEVPGLFVLIIMGIISFVTITILLVVIFKKRCKTRSYGGPQTFRRSQEIGTQSHMNSKVSEAVAFEENVGMTVSKFVNISTPLQQAPTIKVTRPTITESSISLDFDSTFDRSPASVQEMEGENSTV